MTRSRRAAPAVLKRLKEPKDASFLDSYNAASKKILKKVGLKEEYLMGVDEFTGLLTLMFYAVVLYYKALVPGVSFKTERQLPVPAFDNMSSFVIDLDALMPTRCFHFTSFEVQYEAGGGWAGADAFGRTLFGGYNALSEYASVYVLSNSKDAIPASLAAPPTAPHVDVVLMVPLSSVHTSTDTLSVVLSAAGHALCDVPTDATVVLLTGAQREGLEAFRARAYADSAPVLVEIAPTQSFSTLAFASLYPSPLDKILCPRCWASTFSGLYTLLREKLGMPSEQPRLVQPDRVRLATVGGVSNGLIRLPQEALANTTAVARSLVSAAYAMRPLIQELFVRGAQFAEIRRTKGVVADAIAELTSRRFQFPSLIGPHPTNSFDRRFVLGMYLSVLAVLVLDIALFHRHGIRTIAKSVVHGQVVRVVSLGLSWGVLYCIAFYLRHANSGLGALAFFSSGEKSLVWIVLLTVFTAACIVSTLGELLAVPRGVNQLKANAEVFYMSIEGAVLMLSVGLPVLLLGTASAYGDVSPLSVVLLQAATATVLCQFAADIIARRMPKLGVSDYWRSSVPTVAGHLAGFVIFFLNAKNLMVMLEASFDLMTGTGYDAAGMLYTLLLTLAVPALLLLTHYARIVAILPNRTLFLVGLCAAIPVLVFFHNMDEPRTLIEKNLLGVPEVSKVPLHDQHLGLSFYCSEHAFDSGSGSEPAPACYADVRGTLLGSVRVGQDQLNASAAPQGWYNISLLHNVTISLQSADNQGLAQSEAKNGTVRNGGSSDLVVFTVHEAGTTRYNIPPGKSAAVKGTVVRRCFRTGVHVAEKYKWRRSVEGYICS